MRVWCRSDCKWQTVSVPNGPFIQNCSFSFGFYQVWWSSLGNNLLSPGFLDNLKSWVASRPIFIMSPVVWLSCRTLWISTTIGDFLSRNDPCSNLVIVHCFVVPSTCGVSWRRGLQKPLEFAKFLKFVIKRRSANRSWQVSSKVASLQRQINVFTTRYLGNYSSNTVGI